MGKHKKLSHVVYKCEYHIVWVPKYRYRVLTGAIEELVTEDIRMLCEWKGCEVQELNVQIDHIHLLASIPPRVSVSELMGTLKGIVSDQVIQELSSIEAAALLGQSFLGSRVFCGNGWIERRSNKAICEVPRRGRKEGRTWE